MDHDSRAKSLIKLSERFRSRKTGNARRRLTFGDENFTPSDTARSRHSPVMAEHNELTSHLAEHLRHKYNFDFVNEKPVSGGEFSWEKVDDPVGKGVPEFYMRPPHRRKRPAFRDILEQKHRQEVTPTGGQGHSNTASTLPTTSTGSKCISQRRQQTIQSPQDTTSVTSHVTTATVTRRLFTSSCSTPHTSQSASSITFPSMVSIDRPQASECISAVSIDRPQASECPSTCDRLHSPVSFKEKSTYEKYGSEVSISLDSVSRLFNPIPRDDSGGINTAELTEEQCYGDGTLKVSNPDTVSISDDVTSSPQAAGSSAAQEVLITETPGEYGDIDRKRKLLTDHFPEKKKKSETTVRRKLYDNGD